MAVTAHDKYIPEFCSRNVLLRVNVVPVPTSVGLVRLFVELVYHSTTSLSIAFDQAQPEQVAVVPIGTETLEVIPVTTGYLATAGLAKDGIRLPRLEEVAVPPSPVAVLTQ